MKSFYIVGLFLFFVSSAQARVIEFGSEPEDINLYFGSPTLFRFEKPVKTISRADAFQIRPANPDRPDYTTLAVEPRSLTSTSQVVFILNDQTVIKTRLVVLPQNSPSKTEAIYEFRSKQSLVEDEKNEPFVGKIDLMKALIRGDIVAGYKIDSPNTEVPSGMKGLTARLTRTYLGKDFNGYVYDLKNQTSSRIFRIDLRKLNLGMPNLAIFSEIDLETLPPGKSAELHIVAKPASLYRQIILPVTWEEKR